MAEGDEGQDVIARIPLVDQIAEVKREITMRRRVYTDMVRLKRMTAEDAAVRSERMMAVQRTLERLRERELAVAGPMT